MTAIHVIWFTAAFCGLLGGSVTWLWASYPRDGRSRKKRALAAFALALSIVSICVCLIIGGVIIHTLLPSLQAGAEEIP